MLYLHLKPIFAARGIEKPFSFLTKNGFNNNSAHRLLNSETRVIKLDHIERLCEILVCEPTDLFQWFPDSGKNYLPNNPLHQLISSKENQNDLQKTLSSLPYQKLKDLSAKITTEIQEKE